mgnify:CR=1 FL=1
MKKALLGLCFGVFATTTASASVITYENRATDSGVDQSDYQSSWNNQSSSIYSSDITSFNRLQLCDKPRKEFIKKFSRSNIMSSMAEDIIEFLKGRSK